MMKPMYLALLATAEASKLARTPPMGWMSWEIFRCDIDCDKDPHNCISERLYKEQADAMVNNGFAAHGYASIHMDDCWEQKVPPRDPTTKKLRGDPKRFPSGMKALGDYYHKLNLSFATYTAESSTTCGGYPASAEHEALDAKTFAEWGVDYIKVDGCGPADYYAGGYKAMGKALQASGRDIVYSCSWPAYTGSDETTKPFQTYIDDACNLWRNYADIQCSWDSLGDIIEHWGKYGKALQPWAGPDGPYGGHWHDMDMLLIGGLNADGAPCVSLDEERTQMAIWAISASPLIMGNDMRNVSAASKAILFNKHAIAVSQDPAGIMGIRLTDGSTAAARTQQLWARELSPTADGRRRAAAALYHHGGAPPPLPPMPPAGQCPQWTHTQHEYYEACDADNVGTFSDLTVAEAQAACCANTKCAGFSFSNGGDGGVSAKGSGYYKGNANCGLTKANGYDGYTKTSQIPGPPPTAPVDMTLDFALIPSLAGAGAIDVMDIWTGGTTSGVHRSYTASAVPLHGTAFLLLTEVTDDNEAVVEAA